MDKRRARKVLAIILIIAELLTLLILPCYAAEEQKVIRVGWYESGNDDSNESTGAHGYDYEYLQALSQYTGWKYEYVTGTWDECLDMLETGEIDILGYVMKTAEREKVLGFPSLPMAVTNAWLVVNNSSSINSVDKNVLNGMTVGLVEGSAHNNDFTSYCKTIKASPKTVMYERFSDLPKALASGEIDAAVVSDEDKTATENGILKINSAPQYFVTSKKNTELLSELDSAMLQVSEYFPSLNNDLFQKYFAKTADNKPNFTAAEEEFIKTHPNILVKYDSGWPPVEYFDEKINDYKGISPDLFKLLSKKCGINFVYEGSTSGAVLADLQKSGEKNVLTTISYDYDWAEKHNVFITQPFVTSSIVKLGKNLNAKNAKVAINEKAYFTYALKDELVGLNTQHYAKQVERLEAVRTGKADYTFVTEDQARYYCSIPKYSDLKYEKMVGYNQSICISVTNNSDPELISILSKALASVSHDEMTDIIVKNTVNSYDITFADMLYEYRLPLVIVIVLLIAVIAILIIINTIKRKSEKQLQAAYAQEQLAHEQMKEALDIAKKASAAKGSFMSRMSHEIRTPLNAVIGYNTIARSEMVSANDEAERKQADMKVMDCLTKSEMASKHLLTVINDVLDMSAIESGKIKVANDKFDFKTLITSLTSIFYSQAKTKGVDFEVLFDTLTEEWFVGDQMRVNQILTNLLSNAIKFTSEGGSVKLVICQPEAEENAAHIHFEVIDTGIGMSKEYLQHIWSPFEQEDVSISRRFGGSGLGLSITKNLVDLMDGTIEVISEQAKGSTFKVDLTFERTEQPKRAKTYDFSSINALIVDDDLSTCDYVRLLFTRCGARCEAVTSGKAALEKFKEAENSNDEYNLCLVDWRMPQMDGLETVKKIREVTNKDIPIIIITAYDFSEISPAAKDAGVNMFVSKPIFQSSLFDLLANISGKQNPVKISNNITYDFGGARVLLAEDNAMNMEVAKRVLESVNLVVDGVQNGLEAIGKFNAEKPGSYRVILMDVQMPEMDGHEATRTIRASNHPEAETIPIIAMTADAFAENVKEALDAGMNDHVSKPIDMPKLFEVLEKYIPNKAEVD